MDTDDRKLSNLDEFHEIVENVKYLHMSPDKKKQNNIYDDDVCSPSDDDTKVKVVVGIDDDLQMILDMDPSIIDYKVADGPKCSSLPMTNSGYSL